MIDVNSSQKKIIFFLNKFLYFVLIMTTSITTTMTRSMKPNIKSRISIFWKQNISKQEMRLRIAIERSNSLKENFMKTLQL